MPSHPAAVERVVPVVVERGVVGLPCDGEGPLFDAVGDAPDGRPEVGVLGGRGGLRAAGDGAVVDGVVPAEDDVALGAVLVRDNEVGAGGAVRNERRGHALLLARSGRMVRRRLRSAGRQRRRSAAAGAKRGTVRRAYGVAQRDGLERRGGQLGAVEGGERRGLRHGGGDRCAREQHARHRGCC